MNSTNQNLPAKKIGRPLGAKSTMAYNLGQLYNKFGPNACPEIGVVWLKQNGILDANNNFIIDNNNNNNNNQSIITNAVNQSNPTDAKVNVQVLDLSDTSN